jgi:hypothetical protein
MQWNLIKSYENLKDKIFTKMQIFLHLCVYFVLEFACFADEFRPGPKNKVAPVLK